MYTKIMQDIEEVKKADEALRHLEALRQVGFDVKIEGYDIESITEKRTQLESLWRALNEIFGVSKNGNSKEFLRRLPEGTETKIGGVKFQKIGPTAFMIKGGEDWQTATWAVGEMPPEWLPSYLQKSLAYFLAKAYKTGD